MDFFQIRQKNTKTGICIYPDFGIGRSKDIMIRGKAFYAIWDQEKGLWSTDEYDVARLVDQELKEYLDKLGGLDVDVRWMKDYSSGSWKSFKQFMKDVADNSRQLDNKIIFASDTPDRKDYASHKLPYDLQKKKCPAWNELVGTLYSQEEREKIEWAIGSIIAGDSMSIQKFFVFFGDPGSGKSTILKIIEKLFEGYYTEFEAKDLVSNKDFALESFHSNPLVAIQHDGDLSRIEDNTKLNSIISHETMIINEKFKSKYSMKINSMLFMATNKPVKITDAKAGIIRRLVDISPTGVTIPNKRYETLLSQIDFELGAIAQHCLDVYRKLGKSYYNAYKPFEMIQRTDVFYNFVEDNFEIFKENDGTSLKAAYSLYKVYYEDSGLEYKLPMYKFREELKNYFKAFYDVYRMDGKQVRSYFEGFKTEKFTKPELKKEKEEAPVSLVLDRRKSLLDEMLADCPAQYAKEDETPKDKWSDVITKLSDIDTKKLHYVKVPTNHIVIDFDLKNEKGEKDHALNLEAASKWPPTYAEASKGGAGIHLHYIYTGDVKKLARLYSEGIEVKVFTGNASLRRRVSKCNNIPVAEISSGLPLKEEKVVNFDAIKSEKALRTLIERNLHKEIHPGTKPSIDFIAKILDDAYTSGLKYDVTDLRPRVMAFANNSSHQADYCIKMVNKMKFQSDETSVADDRNYKSDDLVFYDVEVFPNLFVVVWKLAGEEHKCVEMINPTPAEIEDLVKFKLVGFNCRRYDNHIMYARMMGYSNEQLYSLSQRIVNDSKNCFFGEAYNLSYTDVYDFAAAMNKQSLKKWEIQLGIHHQELGLPWDQPVDRKLWSTVADYCCNDVISTEATFNHLAGDWAARQILAELSGLTVNDTTNNHTTRIIFGSDPHPQDQFIYTDLSEMFPGYTFDHGKSLYKGYEVGEGGFVYAEPGMYGHVGLFDVESMHPSSIENLNLFGDKYTKRFSELKQARIAIKHKDMDKLKKLLDGKLVKYIEDPKFNLKDLSNALKTVINSVYGLTSARFDNKFRDKRNIDNIVAKRGALFMIDLLEAVKEKGYKTAHIKTDSIKIPDYTDSIKKFVMDFGKKYGYNFEHEATYDKMCLVNDAVYIARYEDGVDENGKLIKGSWTATGAEFAVPYIFKTLFSGEKIEFKDLCMTASVKTSLYLDMNENLPEDEHNYVFIGRVGQFCPMKSGAGGGVLYSLRGEDKYYAVAGSKGYRFLESEMVKALSKEDEIDESYFVKQANDAIKHISEFGDFEWFRSEQAYDGTIPFDKYVGDEEAPF